MTNEELQKLSYEDLVKLEDKMSLENEISLRWRVRLASGRIIVFVMSAMLWGALTLLWFGLMSLMPRHIQDLLAVFNPIFILATLFLAIFMGDTIWRAIGCGPRMILRYILHYWLVVFVLAGTIFSIIW